MIQRCGIILLEKKELTIRIYEVNNAEWKLLQYQSTELDSSHEETDAAALIETLAEFLVNDGLAVSEWKVAARGLTSSCVQQLSTAIGMYIETISSLREQELLCKGLFTELW